MHPWYDEETFRGLDHVREVLILSGDIQYNLGDTAICLVEIRLVRKMFPDCEIVVLGKLPSFPGGFEGVRFCHLFTLGALRAMRTAQAVLWGGGQLLQGNRSRIKIPYWACVVLLLRLLRKRIMGFAQGVGPLPLKFDRVLTRFTVSCTEVFTVRDEASLRTLNEINVPRGKIFLTADPALILRSDAAGYEAQTHNPQITPQLDQMVSDRPILGVSLRYTHHHRLSRIIPFQFLPLSMRRKAFESEDFCGFLTIMSDLCDRLIEKFRLGITFVPMYYAPWESDVRVAEALAQQMRCKDQVNIFKPSRGVEEIPQLFQRVDAFLGTPMHSTILSIAQCVPTVALHYEPKGRDFFKQIEQQRWTFPLEEIGTPEGPDRLFNLICDLWQEREQIRADLHRTIPNVKKRAMSNADHLSAFLNFHREKGRD